LQAHRCLYRGASGGLLLPSRAASVGLRRVQAPRSALSI